MILVDTSAWVEYLRGSDDAVAGQLTALIREGAELAITEPIAMELMCGATTAARARNLGALVDGLILIGADPRLDYRAAAQLFVASRQNGHPIRSTTDCLIAAVAIRRDVPLLHRDRDFEFLQEISPLQCA